MAANGFDAPAPSIALVAATAKTMVGVFAAANVALQLTEAWVSFDGATSSNVPVVVDLVQSTFATNPPGTNSTAAIAVKRDPARAESFQMTNGKNWIAEPTVLTVQKTVDVGQYNGLFYLILPFAAPIVVPGGKGFAIRATSPNNVNCSCGLAGVE